MTKMDKKNSKLFQPIYIFFIYNNRMSKAQTPTSCRNCRKILNAKNALFCSMSCYKIYTTALERNLIPSLENDTNQTEKLSNFTILKRDQINCIHEYSKNGAMSCRKCGHTNILIN